jgi:hypothetical protein
MNWYAAVIYEVILKKCRQKYPKLMEVIHHSGKAGKYGGVQVRIGSRNTTAKVTMKYNAAWGKAKRDIEAKRKVGLLFWIINIVRARYMWWTTMYTSWHRT